MAETKTAARTVFPAKVNGDGSYSVSVSAKQLVENGWVDFYDDTKGTGYQRHDTDRERRATAIHDYIRRCNETGEEIHLGDLTGNARAADTVSVGVTNSTFKPFVEDERIGMLTLHVRGEKWLAVIDGSTRLRGIERALEAGDLSEDFGLDVRLFIGLPFVDEIAIFLLVNQLQKKARTDLSTRIVQRLIDEHKLTEGDWNVLHTVVPDTDRWNYEASRIADRLNKDKNSPWRGLIQQPNTTEVKPIKLQAFSTSLRGLLADPDLGETLTQLEGTNSLRISVESSKPVKRDEFLLAVLKNFWDAVAEANPRAHTEPLTTLLWGAVGVNGLHIALTPILDRILTGPEPDVSKEFFQQMLVGTTVENYDWWFTRRGDKDENSYPSHKGDAPKMIGASGYQRLGRLLNLEFRRNIKLVGSGGAVKA